MKIIRFLPIFIFPALLMGYGWYLGQLHQSGYDIAGILLFVTGFVGLVLAGLFSLLTRKYPWHGRWYINGLLGLAGCGIAFAFLLALARLHG